MGCLVDLFNFGRGNVWNKDWELEGPVFTMKSLKIPQQLEIDKSRPDRSLTKLNLKLWKTTHKKNIYGRCLWYTHIWMVSGATKTKQCLHLNVLSVRCSYSTKGSDHLQWMWSTKPQRPVPRNIIKQYWNIPQRLHHVHVVWKNLLCFHDAHFHFLQKKHYYFTP